MEQREAEQLMVAELSRRLGNSLAPSRLRLPDGRAVQVDGMSESVKRGRIRDRLAAGKLRN
jgi:hypothetical protein